MERWKMFCGEMVDELNRDMTDLEVLLTKIYSEAANIQDVEKEHHYKNGAYNVNEILNVMSVTREAVWRWNENDESDED